MDDGKIISLNARGRWLQSASALFPRAVSVIGAARGGNSAMLLGRYWPLYGLVFLIGTENFIVSPFLPEMAADLGNSIAALASAVTAYSIAYAVSAPVLGSFSDRLGLKRLIVAGSAVFLSANVLVAVAPSLVMVQLGRGLTGLGGAAAGPAIWAYIAGDSAPNMRGQAIGIGMGAFSLGQVVGIPIGGLVASITDWRVAFGAIGFLMLPLVVTAWLRKSGVRDAALSSAPIPRGFPLLAIWKSRPFVLAQLVNLLFQAGNLSSYTYLGSILARRFQLSTGQIGMVGILVGSGSLGGALAGGKISDRWRQRGGKGAQLHIFWAVLLALSVIIATGDVPLPISMIGIVVWFVASGAFVTTQMALITLFVPTMRATAVSWNNSLMHAGAGLGVWTIGLGVSRGLRIGPAGLVFGLGAATAAALLLPIEATWLQRKDA